MLQRVAMRDLFGWWYRANGLYFGPFETQEEAVAEAWKNLPEHLHQIEVLQVVPRVQFICLDPTLERQKDPTLKMLISDVDTEP